MSDLVASGSLPVALLVAAVAGLVSFASPCVLPLVPGYLGYVTGLNGVALERQRRSRMAAGAAFFVLGFTVVFVVVFATFSSLTQLLVGHQAVLLRVFGPGRDRAGAAVHRCAARRRARREAVVAPGRRPRRCAAARRGVRRGLEPVHGPDARRGARPGHRRRRRRRPRRAARRRLQLGPRHPVRRRRRRLRGRLARPRRAAPPPARHPGRRWSVARRDRAAHGQRRVGRAA